jgi:hypothetical protein
MIWNRNSKEKWNKENKKEKRKRVLPVPGPENSPSAQYHFSHRAAHSVPPFFYASCHRQVGPAGRAVIGRAWKPCATGVWAHVAR